MLSSGLACAFWSFSINSFAMPRIKRKKQQKVQSDDLWIAVVSKYPREEIDADFWNYVANEYSNYLKEGKDSYAARAIISETIFGSI